MTPGRVLLRRCRGVRYLAVPALERLGFRVAFFQRPGGISRGPCRGLNLGFHTRDDPQAVAGNRRLALQCGRFGPLLPVAGRQVHGNRLRLVGRQDAGRGWKDFASGFRGTDGLLTRTPGLPLAVSVADCLPVILAAPETKAAAAVHVGWRGLAANILPKAVQRMQQLGARAKDIWAVLGPGIGPKAFVVRGMALQKLSAVCPAGVRTLKNRRTAFDLWLAARMQLLGQGLRGGRIIAIRDCTFQHPGKYFSFRRDGETGRMLGMIQIIK